jgi:hypothetical protein
LWAKYVSPQLPAEFACTIFQDYIEPLDLDYNLTGDGIQELVAYLRQWAPAIIAADGDAKAVLEGQVCRNSNTYPSDAPTNGASAT